VTSQTIAGQDEGWVDLAAVDKLYSTRLTWQNENSYAIGQRCDSGPCSEFCASVDNRCVLAGCPAVEFAGFVLIAVISQHACPRIIGAKFLARDKSISVRFLRILENTKSCG
jgi:hypothetical protein